jgi:SAM-dependent methyltransferase
MPGNDQRLRGQLPWLRRLPPDIRTVLDVGAGAGSHSALFESLGLKVTAIDADAGNFRFSDRVEFVEGDVMTWGDNGRKFDAVFCSHVFEHVPDLGSFIQRLRSLIRDGGYLVAVVPRYEGISCDEHWHIGWNCSQLALTLVASGFDCSNAVFAELNENVCGWGRKSSFKPTQFGIAESAPYLPRGMAKSIFSAGSGNLHLRDLVFADRDEVRQRRATLNERVDGFRDSDAVTLAFGPGEERRDAVFLLDPFLDLSSDPLRIVALQEGGTTVLRVAVDSSEAGDYTETSEYFLDQRPGFSAARIHWHDFHGAGQPTRFEAIRRVVIGGTGQAATVKCWIYAGGRPLTQPAPELAARQANAVDPDRKTSMSPSDVSRAYFERNRAKRLDREVKRLQDALDKSASEARRVEGLRGVLNAALRRVRELNPVAREGAEDPAELMHELLGSALTKVRELEERVGEGGARIEGVEEIRQMLTVALGRVRQNGSHARLSA